MSKIPDKINAAKQLVKYGLLAKKGGGKLTFVNDFMANVLCDTVCYEACEEIETLMAQLQKFNIRLAVQEVGGGSRKFKNNPRKISDLIRYSSIQKKYGRLLFRMVQYYKPQNIFELGTSIGISSMYLAKGNEGTHIDTIEANPSLIKVAKNGYKQLKIRNISTHQGCIEDVLPKLLLEKTPEMAFVDGNHTYGGTLQYYKLLRRRMEHGILIFDDIYWSKGMQKAWEKIKSEEKLTVDLYQLGIVIFGQSTQSGHCCLRY